METNPEARWVAERLDTLEPPWRPDLARGCELLHARQPVRRRPWASMTTAAVAAAVLIVALAFPETRALAQQLWDRLVLNRVFAVRVDLSKLPLRTRITTNGVETTVRNMDEAERLAGFRPYVPSPGLLDGNPRIEMTGPIAVEQTIHVRDIESALGKAGGSDVSVPAEWEGLQLHYAIGPSVAENYPDNVRILQTRPIELFVPSGFAMERFADVAFRSVGIPAWEARAMARDFAAHPAWLFDIPAGAVANIQVLALQAGPALLIEDLDEKGAVARAMVIRNTSERMYSVSSGSRALSVQIANSLP